MSRIRTIKPEFPQSESMGKISRESRLLFVLLWTVVDDAGRARAASRLLASLLYPYDEDAPSLIDGWLDDLEASKSVVRYEVDGTRYLQITKWLEHQKIDRPSKSRFPAFDEASRALANDREPSSTDLGPSTLDLVLKEIDSAGAKTPMIRPEAFSVSDGCLLAIGLEPENLPPAWFGLPHQIEMMLARGYDPPQIVATFARLKSSPLKPMRYFVKAVESDQQTTIKPAGVPNAKSGSVHQAHDRFIAQLNYFDQPAPDEARICSGEGQNSIRAISSG